MRSLFSAILIALTVFLAQTNARAQSLEFYQPNLNLDSTITLNSDWGMVDLTFAGSDSILYFNLTVNASWQVQNMPVLSVEGNGVTQTQRFWFALGNPIGVDVTYLEYAYAVTTDTLESAPAGATPASVTDKWIVHYSGLKGDSSGVVPPPIQPAQRAVGGKVLDPKQHKHEHFPNQPCGESECVPTAVSNSLVFLNGQKKWNLMINLDRITIKKMKIATNWKPEGCQAYDGFLFGNAWWKDKDAYMNKNGLPFTTRMIESKDIDKLIGEIDKGQDIEVMLAGIDRDTHEFKGHAVCLVGIADLGNERYQLTISHDLNQTNDPEGLSVDTVIWSKRLSEWISGGLFPFMDLQRVDYFVVECPSITSTSGAQPEADGFSEVPMWPNTVWYGGTDISAGRPLAAVGGTWTWNAAGWGGIPHSGYDLDGWTRGGSQEDWVHLIYNPTANDPCVPADPMWCAMGDSVVAMYDLTASPTAPHGNMQESWVVSPVIPIAGTDGAGLPTHIIQFERSAYLPLYNHVFYAWYVRYFPHDYGYGPEWSGWGTNNALYYSPTTSCGTVAYDVSAQVPACAESVQIVMVTKNLCVDDPWGLGCTNVNNYTPYFDNVRFGAAGNANAPSIADMEWDKFLDMFPTDGTLNCGSTANAGISVSGDPTCYAMGDSLVVSGFTCPGSPGMEVWMHWKVTPGACLNTASAWFEAFPPSVWNSARMDTAQSGDMPANGAWMGSYHEADPNYGLTSGRWAGEANEIIPDGLLTLGTKVDYYISTNYVGNVNSFVLQNQEPGYTNLPDELTILPSVTGSPNQWRGEYPCLLYVDDADGLGAQRWVEDALRCVPTNWDRYDKRAPTSAMMNGIGRAGGSEKGATLTQLQAYSSVLLDALNVYAGSIEIEDTNLFTGWLSGATASNPRFLALFGDDIARYLNGNATRKTFMNTYMGTTYSTKYYYSTSGNTSWCVDIADLAGNRIDGGAMLTEGSLRANMCPNNFNIIGVQAGTNGVGECEFADANPTVHLNVVSNQVVDGSSNVLYRTVFSSYSTARVRSLGCPGGVNGWSFGDSVGVCGTPTLKGWQDDVRDKVLWGGGTGTCTRIIGVPGGVNVSSRAIDELKRAYPNPMNPATTISFAVKSDGKVSLRIYDATGRLVKTLVDSRLKAGSHTVPWDGTNDRGVKAGSGVFFYQIETEGGFRSAKKIVILK